MTTVLAGLSDLSLLTNVDCDDEDADEEHGVLMRVPSALYRGVAERLVSIGLRSKKNRLSIRDAMAGWAQPRVMHDSFLVFLARRSSDAFLRTYLQADPGFPARITAFGSFVEAVQEPNVLARLHQAHLLPEQVRLRAVERMAYLAVQTPDAGWTHLPAWKVLLTPGERAQLMDTVRSKLVAQLAAGEEWFPDERDEDDPVERALFNYQMAFEDAGDTETASALAEALITFRELPTRPPENWDPDWGWDPEPDRDTAGSGYESHRSSLAPPPKPSRSIFDDIDR